MSKPCCNPSYEAEIKRVNRIMGQVEGVKKMIEEQRYCPDIINQILAAASSLHSLGGVLLKTHIENCVYTAFESDNPKEKEEKLEELIKLYNKKLT